MSLLVGTIFPVFLSGWLLSKIVTSHGLLSCLLEQLTYTTCIVEHLMFYSLDKTATYLLSLATAFSYSNPRSCDIPCQTVSNFWASTSSNTWLVGSVVTDYRLVWAHTTFECRRRSLREWVRGHLPYLLFALSDTTTMSFSLRFIRPSQWTSHCTHVNKQNVAGCLLQYEPHCRSAWISALDKSSCSTNLRVFPNIRDNSATTAFTSTKIAHEVIVESAIDLLLLEI